MAVTREGASEGFNDGATPSTEAVTVPGDATLMVITATYGDATANAGISAASLDGDPFTQIGDYNSDTADAMVDTWYLANPSTGSQTLSWTFTEAISEGPGWIVTYYKGCDTADPIRDFDSQANSGSSPTETGSFDSGTDDLCVVATADYGQAADSAPTDKGQTEDEAQSSAGPQGSVGDKAGGGASETMWFGGDTYSGAVAFSIKVAGGAATQTLYPDAIASLEAFGSDKLNFGLSMSGLPSAEAFGTQKLNHRIEPSAISSLEAFGTQKLNYAIAAAGIASVGAFGTPKMKLFLLPTSISSLESFGTPGALDFILKMAGIPSSEVFGALTVVGGVSITERVFIVTTPGLVNISTSGDLVEKT